MPKCQVTRCLFCIPLRAGVLTMGYIKAVLSVTCMALSVMMVVIILNMQSDTSDQLMSMYGNRRIFEKVLSYLLMFYAVAMAKFLPDTLFAVILLIGGHKTNPRYISVYYNYSLVSLSIWVLMTFASFFLDRYLTLNLIIWSGLEIYFIFIVRGYLRKLQRTERTGYDGLQENELEVLEEL